MLVAERHIIKKGHRFWAEIDNLSWQSKNLYNSANYLIRQNFIGSPRLCVIIFAYGILKCLLDKTFRTILRIFYQYRPRFHTETRRAKNLK